MIEEVEVEPLQALLPETPRFTAMDRLALHRANVEDNPLPLRVAWGASIIALLLLIAAVLRLPRRDRAYLAGQPALVRRAGHHATAIWRTLEPAAGSGDPVGQNTSWRAQACHP